MKIRKTVWYKSVAGFVVANQGSVVVAVAILLGAIIVRDALYSCANQLSYIDDQQGRLNSKISDIAYELKHLSR